MAAPLPPRQLPRRKTLIGDHPITTARSMEECYEAGDVIGTGSFGIIRKVTRRLDGKVLARKELNYGRMDERDLKQLTEEVNILEQLGSNDNIVRYYERFVDKPNNMLYILMEYCEGGDLAGVIQRCRKTSCILPEDVVWAYLTQITLALHDCHSEMDKTGKRKTVILHRDIKPENVFLDKENNLKLGDFGLSKAMQQAAMTQTYVGTPYYMSPELINGQPYDVKSDIWALGCLIYELCAGHPPFHEARTQPELAVMIREGKIPDLPKPYTAHLGQVVKAMLQQNPKRRPNTSQIKTLDLVKLQIRAIELRKASRELRVRDAHVAEREKDILEREASVLAREQAVLSRENAVRAAQDGVKEGEAKLQAAWAALRAAQQQIQPVYGQERENVRPSPVLGQGGQVVVEEAAIARVASRPSLVPRRPLQDERRMSNAAPSLPFPRVSSSSSLMSLDDTPTKPHPASPSLRRRLASKSMHDLSGAGGYHTPTRTISVSNDNLRAAALAQQREIAAQQLALQEKQAQQAQQQQQQPQYQHHYSAPQRSPLLVSIPVTYDPPLPSLPAPHSRHLSSPVLPLPLPLQQAPQVTSATASASLPHAAPGQHSGLSSAASSPSIPTYSYADDDVPSPFLKKPTHSAPAGRLPITSSSAGQQQQAGGGGGQGKPTLMRRLLTTRATSAAAASQGGGGGLAPEIPQRRVSIAPKRSTSVGV
ncbi:hypothetical protein JCM8097_008596 [Rhodosporidiobolus ruineniae]